MLDYRAPTLQNPFHKVGAPLAAEGLGVIEITDTVMHDRLSQAKAYSAVLLRKGPRWESPDAKQIIWEHGRRNFELRESKRLAIVCPLGGTTDLRGLGIFDADSDETARIIAEDPA